MAIKFNIQEIVESEIYYGYYVISILGGHHVEVNPDFYIKIINIETNEILELTEKNLKGKDFKSGRKAVEFFTFQINEYGKFRISVHNFEDIIIKDSMLELFPFPFSLPHITFSNIFGRRRNKISLNEIEILIS